MSHELKVIPKEGYLHVTVHGINSAETVLSYLSEVRDACLRDGSAKVPIEENLQGPGLGMGNVFEVITKASANVWPALLRIAFVDMNPGHDPKAMGFAETVASNRGVSVRVFGDLGEARQWLVSGPLSAPLEKG
jgi:hypothetical protein